MNPFPAPGPLCPWESPDDAGHYAVVDNSLHAFEEFQRAVPDCAPLTRKGRVVLISGGSGCGKTSLMHRCAHWLEGRPLPADHTIHIVNLTEDHMKGADSERRVRDIYGRVVDELLFEAAYDEKELSFLNERRDNPDQAYPGLSKLLHRRGQIIVVLLPSSTVADEVIRYADLTRKNMLFFAETPFDDVAETCRRQLGPGSAKPVLQLRVGALGIEDGWSYLSHFVPPGGGTDAPLVPEETMRSVVETRINGSGRMTVTELQRLLHGIFEKATADGRTTLAYDDFRDYAFETARLI